MRKFRYRAPRFPVDFPVRLIHGESTQSAICKEISTLGMKLELHEALMPHSFGTIHLSVEDVAIALPFQATSSELKHGGVRFVYESEEQRNAVQRLVECLTAPKPCTSLARIDHFPAPKRASTPQSF
jgi:hypothetical protein